jgi:hypothetical protein
VAEPPPLAIMGVAGQKKKYDGFWAMAKESIDPDHSKIQIQWYLANNGCSALLKGNAIY